MEKAWKTIKWAVVTLWEDYMMAVRVVCYILVIIFLIFGVIALFTGGAGLGIFLIVLNGLLLLLMRRLDRISEEQFERDFQEMVQKNREDQDPAGERGTK